MKANLKQTKAALAAATKVLKAESKALDKVERMALRASTRVEKAQGKVNKLTAALEALLETQKAAS